MTHKSGFVSIIGKPNVGKSTLLNAILGQKLSITTPKAQTTRHRIKGILNEENYQIVFSDTPGIMKPAYLLQEKMMNFVQESLVDADVVVFLSDKEEAYLDEELKAKLKAITVPLIVVINKIDLSSQGEIAKLIAGWKKHIHPHAILPISATENFNLNVLKELLVTLLPEAPPYYNKEEVSDLHLRFFAAEIIREKILMHFDKEIPYSVQVEIESFKEEETRTHIVATIYVERDSQKGILIGHKGEGIKRIGMEARKDISTFIGRNVHLENFIKVEKEWRKLESKLKAFGYNTGSGTK
ncbi:MAG: GTPase Era [Bacteroidota bacterium]|jgi:GTP-binding protein Era